MSHFRVYSTTHLVLSAHSVVLVSAIGKLTVLLLVLHAPRVHCLLLSTVHGRGRCGHRGCVVSRAKEISAFHVVAASCKQAIRAIMHVASSRSCPLEELLHLTLATVEVRLSELPSICKEHIGVPCQVVV